MWTCSCTMILIGSSSSCTRWIVRFGAESSRPLLSHFLVFGCKFFILKKGKKLDKFEARSVDGIFFGYAAQSRAYRVLNLETNQIVETCKVTFDKTQPRSQLVF
jgi:hypothetical protein